MMLRLLLVPALGSVVAFASAALPAPEPLPNLPTTKTLKKRPTKLATVNMTWGAGDRADAVAFLLDSRDRPLAGRTVRFELKSWRDEVVSTCTGTTDSTGRSHCLLDVPNERSTNFVLLSTFPGERLLRSSTAEGAIRTEAPLFRGQGGFAGGSTIELSDVAAQHRRPVRLRARVEQGSTPIEGGRVRFLSNGIPLGVGTTNAAGIATLRWRPRTRQLETYRQLTGAAPRKMGGIQAVYEASTGDTPAVAIAAAEVFPPLTTCEAIGGRFCESRNITTPRVTVHRRGRIRVRRHSFGRASVVRQPHIEMAVTAPAEPASTFSCDPRHVPAAGFCRTSCTRLEYGILQATGQLHALVGTDLDACTEPFNRELDVAQRAAETAWDACALRAAGRADKSWRGTVRVSVPVRVGARFAFRDPSTKKTKTGWKAELRVKHRIREFTINLPVDVECR